MASAVEKREAKPPDIPSNNTNKPEVSFSNGIRSNGGYNLLDGAQPQFPPIAPELDFQRKIAADKNRSIDERLEAFEDIIDSEIGDTNLTRARNVEREFGLRQIFLKFEGTTPTGTQKDRIAFAQVMDALRRGYDTVTVATCGNYGAAVSLAASIAGIDCEIYIPEKYHTGPVSYTHLTLPTN